MVGRALAGPVDHQERARTRGHSRGVLGTAGGAWLVPQELVLWPAGGGGMVAHGIIASGTWRPLSEGGLAGWAVLRINPALLWCA